MMVMHSLVALLHHCVHLEDEVEGLIRPSAAPAALELHRACTARRCGQRRDLDEWVGLAQPLLGAATARVMAKVVLGAASWMLTLTWATKLPMPALVGKRSPGPCPARHGSKGLIAPVGSACAATGAGTRAAQAANRPGSGPRKPTIRIMTCPSRLDPPVPVRESRRPHAPPSANAMAGPPSAPQRCGPVPGISSSRRTHRGDHSRYCLRYHPLRQVSILHRLHTCEFIVVTVAALPLDQLRSLRLACANTRIIRYTPRLHSGVSSVSVAGSDCRLGVCRMHAAPRCNQDCTQIARRTSIQPHGKIHQPTKGQYVHIKNAAKAVTAVMRAGLRRAVILPVACLALGAASLIAPTAAWALPTSCGGDACFSQASINRATFWAWAQSLSFYGHFELQTPEHTVKNTKNEQWNVGVQRQFLDLPQDSGKYCITAWQLVGTNGYNKIGYACMTITA